MIGSPYFQTKQSKAALLNIVKSQGFFSTSFFVYQISYRWAFFAYLCQNNDKVVEKLMLKAVIFCCSRHGSAVEGYYPHELILGYEVP